MKTLKEIYQFCYECGKSKKFCDLCTKVVIVEHLKEEAVKWIRNYRKYEDGFPVNGFQIDEEFMKFFNITEEDLNEN